MGLKAQDIKKLAGLNKRADNASPRVYVGTYKKYSEGNIAGEWLDLDDYYDAEDFYEAAKELHKDEEDPELMYQDSEGVPDWAISESYINPKYWEFMELTKGWDTDQQEAFSIFCDYYYGDAMDKTDMGEAVEAFEERYQGRHDSVKDYAYQLIDDIGGPENVSNPEFYFDSESFARDVQIDGWSYATAQDAEQYPDDYPDGPGTYTPDGEFYSDERLEDVVNEWHDDGSIGEEQMKNYFDYDKFANDLELGGDIYEQGGHIFNAN